MDQHQQNRGYKILAISSFCFSYFSICLAPVQKSSLFLLADLLGGEGGLSGKYIKTRRKRKVTTPNSTTKIEEKENKLVCNKQQTHYWAVFDHFTSLSKKTSEKEKHHQSFWIAVYFEAYIPTYNKTMISLLPSLISLAFSENRIENQKSTNKHNWQYCSARIWTLV